MSTEADIIESIDWGELWKEALLAASWRKWEKDPVKFFDKKAKWYNQTVMRQTDNAQKISAKFNIDYGCSVLDIGSGPGTLAIPLAKTAGKITAVDPSSEMLRYLEENANKKGIKNITCVNKKWEDVEIGKDIGNHDIVISSYSLAMTDIKKALSMMDQAANRTICIFTSAGKTQWDYHVAIWPKLFKEAFVPGPDYIFVVNILYQLGIMANVAIWEKNSRKKISDIDEAVKERLEYFNSSLPDAETIIRECLEKDFTRDEEGLWAERNSKTAMIWWEKTTEEQGNARRDG
jgi:SAM-dependent methyltransferase